MKSRFLLFIMAFSCASCSVILDGSNLDKNILFENTSCQRDDSGIPDDQAIYIAGFIKDLNGGSFPFTGSSKIYSSLDGSNWSQIGTMDTNYYFSQSLVFQGKMWKVGAFNPADGVVRTVFFTSTDGVTWTSVQTSGYIARDAGFVVHGGKMYSIGGVDTANNDTAHVQSSSDGINWTSLADFSAGTIIDVIIMSFQGKIWLLGGNVAGGGNSDTIYSSTDGTSWTNEGTITGGAQPISGYSVAVTSSRAYILGKNAQNNLYYSDDGVNWVDTAVTTPSNRFFTPFVSHRGSIFSFGGLSITANFDSINSAWKLVTGSTPSWETLATLPETITGFPMSYSKGCQEGRVGNSL